MPEVLGDLDRLQRAEAVRREAVDVGLGQARVGRSALHRLGVQLPPGLGVDPPVSERATPTIATRRFAMIVSCVGRSSNPGRRI